MAEAAPTRCGSRSRGPWFDFPRASAPPPSLREGLGALTGGIALAVAMFWPLVLHLDRDLPKDLGDPLLAAWEVAWNGHALLHQPFDWWNANAFWPNSDSLAFSDAFLGYTPMAVLGGGFESAIWHYNVLFLFAYGLSFAGAYLLARELGLRPAAALVAGAAFAYSPWRWEQSGHLNVLSSGGIPLSLMLLLRGYRRTRPRAVVAGWLVAAWQVLIGATLGLQLTYLLGLLTVVTLVVWWRAGRPRPPPAIVRATVAGAIVLAVVLVVVARPYLRVRDDYPESRRTLAAVAQFSPPPRAFLSAPADNLLWGGPTEEARSGLRSTAEQTLFPGALTVALAGLGLAAATWSRRLRIGLAFALVMSVLFSLGLEPLDGRFTYRLLFDHAPGWDGSRTPGRLHTLTTLVLSLLAGAGAHALATELGTQRRPRARTRITPTICVAFTLIVLVEGSAFRVDAGRLAGPTHLQVPRPPEQLARARAPLLHLPAEDASNPADDGVTYRYMLWSTDGFPKIVNGTSGFVPTRTLGIGTKALGFPDRRSVNALRGVGIRAVVIHLRLARGTPWEGAVTRSIARLGVSRRRSGDVVLFTLRAD